MLRNDELASFELSDPEPALLCVCHQLGNRVSAVTQIGQRAYLIPIINKLMGKAKKVAVHRPNTGQSQSQTPSSHEIFFMKLHQVLLLMIFRHFWLMNFCYRSMMHHHEPAVQTSTRPGSSAIALSCALASFTTAADVGSRRDRCRGPRHRIEEIEASLLLHTMRHVIRTQLGHLLLDFPKKPPPTSPTLFEVSAIAELELVQEGPTRVGPMDSLRTARRRPVILRNVELAGYDVRTPIQGHCVPAAVLERESA
ncbi:hypothetical protein SMACR_09582 [Sordaria macrospora]|uniref:WGS project CABT00000000 data, contig 2.103 n=2 Tax=Sordaria macrospora TaxID=5147 RepID=F7WC89_SORMK|nr:uncharacterized protein SMAC_09582 [Sordaria macrospora k-hell]KAA8629609.1 hypothetical protein SMACR_09582 [Sordaria macrospora]WPJ64485.1 hypothetical protein SMAC4_09582 [Sordaria macrospora]CCC05567.1 unnamed protein product [Sordaria macrospora k-hell]